MSLNFFQNTCQEAPQNTPEFGLCDDQNGTIAYTDIINRNKWIATVRNVNQKEIVFTAIDKCVIKDNEYPGRGRCDGMLTAQDLIYLIELKDQKPPWQSDAIRQLESTIQFLLENHNISQFKKRKAFACNKKREQFVFIDNEFNKSFMHRTGFRIDIQADILIV